jgi:hypothetical protein
MVSHRIPDYFKSPTVIAAEDYIAKFKIPPPLLTLI